jgi:ribosomal protein S18 acetylase RimI-like enzyme
MQISIRPWSELDLHEIACLTYAAKEGGGPADEEAVARIEAWLRDQFAELRRLAVLARTGQRLVGWVMLVVQNPAKVEVNPWYLGGHPLVAPGYDPCEVGSRLLQAALDWAGDEGFEVVELSVSRDLHKGAQDLDAVDDWYASLGFRIREESVGFFFRLACFDRPALTVPEGIEVQPMVGADREALYRCYHDAMAAGQSRFFFDQSQAERRAYFDTFGVTYGLHEETSRVLIRDGRMVGYAFTIPFGQHLHVDWIGIHPDARRRGLGRFLMLLLMERAAGTGFETMGLSCDTQNSRAIALYRSLGWRQQDAEIKYAAPVGPARAAV